jgi:hypothetical protein
VAKVHEWTDPDTVIVYAYEEDGEETGKTIRADFLFTLKFDEDGKLKIVKTQQLSEDESQKYRQDSQNFRQTVSNGGKNRLQVGV